MSLNPPMCISWLSNKWQIRFFLKQQALAHFPIYSKFEKCACLHHRNYCITQKRTICVWMQPPTWLEKKLTLKTLVQITLSKWKISFCILKRLSILKRRLFNFHLGDVVYFTQKNTYLIKTDLRCLKMEAKDRSWVPKIVIKIYLKSNYSNFPIHYTKTKYTN